MKRNFIAILFCLLCSAGQLFANGKTTEKILSNKENPDNSLVHINCDWDYIDSNYVDPTVFYKNGEPLEYDRESYNGKIVSIPYKIEQGRGYATYHARVRNLKPNEYYGIRLYKSVYGSASLYVNSIPVFISEDILGNPGRKQKERRHIQLVNFSADSNGVADFVFHLSNDDLAKGGILIVPTIASNNHMQYIMHKYVSFETLIAGILLFLVIYNFIIWMLNKKEMMYLFLSLLSIDMIVITCTLDFSLFSYFTYDFTNENHFKTVMFSLAMLIPLYNLYSIHLYEIKFKWNIVALIIDFVCSFYFLVVPLYVSSQTVVILALILYIMSGYLCWLILRNSKPPYLLYQFNVVIIVVLLVTVAYGLVIGQLIPEGNIGITLVKITIMIFGISQSIFAGVRRDVISKSNKQKLARYEKLNDSYSRFIPKRIINFLQMENTGGLEPGNNSVTESLILSANIKPSMESKTEFISDMYFYEMAKYCEVIFPVIHNHGGFIFKEGKDGYLIVFPEKNDKAVKCAIEIISEVKKLNSEKDENISDKLELEIGIHTARVAIGVMGTKDLMGGVACSREIEDVIKISRMNKMLGSDILISEQALDYCRTYIECMYEGVMIELNGAKSLVYKVVPFESMQHSYYNAGEEK